MSYAAHVIVDGSNLATEGRTIPSFAQLQEAVRAYLSEHPDATITVVVDASFAYRIDRSERAALDAAEAAGEVVSPPAGAIGRGDGFLLQIADRVDGTVLSNDSFQEFQEQYQWLFERGRLVGGKPVPRVGWIFSQRLPVQARGGRVRAFPAPVPEEGAAAAEEPTTETAIDEATRDALEPEVPRRNRRRRRGRRLAPQAVNPALAFTTFVLNHRLGDELEAQVERFTSHGAVAFAEGVQCYVPCSGLGRPAPRRARDVLRRGERRRFVIQAFDAPRRGVELALPDVAQLAGAPTGETVEAEIDDITEKAS
jgi:hypothetical protein